MSYFDWIATYHFHLGPHANYNRPCQQLWKKFEKNVLFQSLLFIKNEWLILEIQQGLQNFSSPRIPSSIGQDVRPSRVHLGHMLCANQIFFCNLLLWQVMIDLILLLHRTITNTTFIVFSEHVISTIIKIWRYIKICYLIELVPCIKLFSKFYYLVFNDIQYPSHIHINPTGMRLTSTWEKILYSHLSPLVLKVMAINTVPMTECPWPALCLLVKHDHSLGGT